MRFAPCKGIQDTLPDSIYWIPDLFQWNLDSGFELLVGFRIPTPVFRIPRPRIPDSTSKNFQDSGFQMQKVPGFWNPDSFTWGEIFQWDEPENGLPFTSQLEFPGIRGKW